MGEGRGAGVGEPEAAFLLTRVPPEIADIARRLLDAGHEAWYVGGAVRDALVARAGGREVQPGEVDIATSARPADVQALFKRTVPVGIEHGTVAVLDRAGATHEVTTFRRDVRTDGRHAEVEFGVSLDDDLARRDFTINALAVHPVSGELRDPFGGRADLAAGVVRAVGDAATRFREDRLRVLRALRFAAALGFVVDAATWRALRAAAGDLAHLSRERVRDEWTKTLSRARASTAVALWREAGVLEGVWPELASLPADRDAELDAVPRDPVLLTAAALWRAGAAPRAADQAARRLRFSNKDADRVRNVVEGLSAPRPDPSDGRAVRRWLSALGGPIALDVAAAAAPADAALAGAAARALEARVPLSVADLAVTGEDLLGAGVPPGPAVGLALRRLLEAVLDEPERNTQDDLLALVRASLT